MMLRLLTQYLLQYGRVCVPHVGALRLVQWPPALNLADKILEPPSYAVELHRDESVSGHQLAFLGNATSKQEEEIERELRLFGTAVQKKIAAGGFYWEGLGTITDETETIAFRLPALQPVTAEKVAPPDATHNVLAGDGDVTSAGAMEQAAYASPTGKKRSVSIAVGWVLLLLAVLAVAVLLYLGKFTVAAAGSKLSPTSSLMPKERLLTL